MDEQRLRTALIPRISKGERRRGWRAEEAWEKRLHERTRVYSAKNTGSGPHEQTPERLFSQS